MSFKMRISVLWIFMAMAYLTWLVMLLFDQIISGEAETDVVTLSSYAIGVVVPLIMAFFSVTLKDLANRRANIIVGIIFTGLMILGLAGSLFVTFRPANEILLEDSKVVVAALIAWYAYKWPKEEA